MSAHDRALRVSRTGVWFCAPQGAPVHLETHPKLSRILVSLVERRLIAKGRGLGVEALVSTGWPGERVQKAAGSSRVRMALTRLRQLGLRDYLLRNASGYFIDPAIDVVWVQDDEAECAGT